MLSNLSVPPWAFALMLAGLALFIGMIVWSVARNHGVKRSLFASPYALWMIIFTILPILIIGYYALTDRDGNFTTVNLAQFWDSNYTKRIEAEADYNARAADMDATIDAKRQEVADKETELEGLREEYENAGNKRRRSLERRIATAEGDLEVLRAELSDLEENGLEPYVPMPRGTVNIDAFWLSLWLAFICTAVCLLLGYPAAYFMASRKMKRASSLLILFVVPMWMNITLRTLAMRVLIQDDSIVLAATNWVRALVGLGPMRLNDSMAAVLIAMVYNFLPFMIFPIYTVLSKLDPAYSEASADLGATPVRTFAKVTIPLTVPGIVSGVTMVFMPSVTTFAINDILGGSMRDMLGNKIERVFMTDSNWNLGSAISLVMMVLILLSLTILRKADPNNEGGGM